MKLTHDQALARLSAHDHAALCTLHPTRGVDAVPVVYAVVDGHVGVPIDRVKPKAASRLQRERNLEADARATLLVEHWDHDDWSKLWWVRARLRWMPAGEADLAAALSGRLGERYRQYRDQPFIRVLVFGIVDLTGWAASDPDAPSQL